MEIETRRKISSSNGTFTLSLIVADSSGVQFQYDTPVFLGIQRKGKGDREDREAVTRTRRGNGVTTVSRSVISKFLINDDNETRGLRRFSNRVSGDDKKHRLQIAKSHENGMAEGRRRDRAAARG